MIHGPTLDFNSRLQRDIRGDETPAVALAAPARRDATSNTIRLEITDWFDAPIELAGASREFAIGDVHGHLAQLETLLAAMRDAAGGAGHLTLLGDLIDRGPASLACVRFAARPAAELGFGDTTQLLGNHEMLMLMALSTRPYASDAQDVWIANGGDRTLAEAAQTPNTLMLRREACRAALIRTLGDAAFETVATAALSRQAGNLLFVHAGVDPRLPLARALDRPALSLFDDRHPCWIRAPFLDHAGGFEGGRIVVHGHTPEPRVLAAKGRAASVGYHRLDGSRLGLDGGSYWTGVVAGAEFRTGGYRGFTAGGG